MGRPRYGPEVIDRIVREYREHMLRRTLPFGWVKQKAAELGLHEQTVYGYIHRAEVQRESRERVIAPRGHFDHSEKMRGPGSRTVHASKWEEGW